MTWTVSSGVRSNIRKIALAVLVLAAPAFAMNGTAFADPPQPPPPPPAPAQGAQGEYYNPADQDDWWVYSGTGSF